MSSMAELQTAIDELAEVIPEWAKVRSPISVVEVARREILRLRARNDTLKNAMSTLVEMHGKAFEYLKGWIRENH